MDKIAFVFSGQGDQYAGMGKEFSEKYPAAASVYSLCDRIRPGTSALCFEGPEEALKETKNTQPCLFATELAAAAVLAEKIGMPDAVAGFSLGEVSAAAFSGVFDWETGFRLVCRRGELMQREAEKFDTSMAAVLKLSAETVISLCGRYPDLYPVNFNCPGQISVSGLTTQMSSFFEDVKAAGGRALPLKVKGAFHSPFMKAAADDFLNDLKQAAILPGKIPLYSDLTAEIYTEDIPGLLSAQISSPVQWEKLIGNMIAAGVGTFVEIGPGRTLTNMIRKICNSVRALTAAEFLAETENRETVSAET